jgi:hypothetical protein
LPGEQNVQPASVFYPELLEGIGVGTDSPGEDDTLQIGCQAPCLLHLLFQLSYGVRWLKL